jgi:hypothetical protein
MSKTKKPRNKKMSEAKKERLQQSNSFENNKLNLKNEGGANLRMNNTNRTQSKVFRGASRGS